MVALSRRPPRRNDGRAAPRQRGFVLLMSLVTLVIMTLSSLAMMMMMRSGVSASGNIAFRQAAVRAADLQVESAFQWVADQLTASASALESSALANGYYATKSGVDAGCVASGVTSFDPNAYDFVKSGCAVATSAGPYTLYYVIHRMADTTGPCSTSTVHCQAPPPQKASCPAGSSMDPSDPSFCNPLSSSTAGLVYYRITVKVAGPRRNNRYIQAFVY